MSRIASKRPLLLKRGPLGNNDDWDDFDQECAREVFLPNVETGHIEPSTRVRFAFEAAGHVVRSVENPEIQPTVWIIKLRSLPDHNVDQKHLHQGIRDLLRGIGWVIPKNDLLVQRTGHTILISFVRPTQSCDPHESQEHLQQLLADLP